MQLPGSHGAVAWTSLISSQLFGVQLAVTQHTLTADIRRLLQEAEAGLPEDAAAENSESAAAADRMLLQAGQLLLSSLERLAARAAGSMGESSVSFAELVAGTSEHDQLSSEAAGLRAPATCQREGQQLPGSQLCTAGELLLHAGSCAAAGAHACCVRCARNKLVLAPVESSLGRAMHTSLEGWK